VNVYRRYVPIASPPGWSSCGRSGSHGGVQTSVGTFCPMSGESHKLERINWSILHHSCYAPSGGGVSDEFLGHCACMSTPSFVPTRYTRKCTDKTSIVRYMSGSDMTSVWNQDSDMETRPMSRVPQVGGRGSRSRQFASPRVPGQERLNEAFASAVLGYTTAREKRQRDVRLQLWACFSLTVLHVSMVYLGKGWHEGRAHCGLVDDTSGTARPRC
jgi:hypothetical protein